MNTNEEMPEIAEQGPVFLGMGRLSDDSRRVEYDLYLIPGTLIAAAEQSAMRWVRFVSPPAMFGAMIAMLVLGEKRAVPWFVAVVGFQLAVPEEMRGRVLSMVFTLAQLGFVGILGVGALADAVGDQLALGIFGAIPTILLTGLMAFGWKTLKQM